MPGDLSLKPESLPLFLLLILRLSEGDPAKDRVQKAEKRSKNSRTVSI